MGISVLKQVSAKNIGFAAVFVAAYFLLLRPFRIWVTASLIIPVAMSVDADRDNGLVPAYTPGTTGVYVYMEAYYLQLTTPEVASDDNESAIDDHGGPARMQGGAEKNRFLFKGLGDQFFLLAGVILLAVGAWKMVVVLFGIQALLYVAGAGLLFWGLTGQIPALHGMDFLVGYLGPAVSLLLAVYIVVQPGLTERSGLMNPSGQAQSSHSVKHPGNV